MEQQERFEAMSLENADRVMLQQVADALPY